jgi:hypothetical protein
MSRVLSPDGRRAVRPFLIAAIAAALLPVAPAAHGQKPAYDATQIWTDPGQNWTEPQPMKPSAPWVPAPVPAPSPEPLPTPTPAPAPAPGPAPTPAPGSSWLPPPSESNPAPSAPTAAGTVTVSWEAPAQRVDESPLENLAGFRVYYGTAAGAYTSKLEVNAPSLTTVVISSLPAGTYWFVVTAYDAEGLESVYSEAASTYVSS